MTVCADCYGKRCGERTFSRLFIKLQFAWRLFSPSFPPPLSSPTNRRCLLFVSYRSGKKEKKKEACKKNKWFNKRLKFNLPERVEEKSWMKESSDTGSQNRCGRVGRGVQPLSIPHIQMYAKSIQNICFSTFWFNHFQWIDGPKDRRTKPVIELRVRN